MRQGCLTQFAPLMKTGIPFTRKTMLSPDGSGCAGSPAAAKHAAEQLKQVAQHSPSGTCHGLSV